MKMVSIIEKKRDSLKLSYEELEFFVKGISDKSIPDYQTTAFLMAAYLNGLDDEETSMMCLLMANSGHVMSFHEDLVTVDKHSTGGVGDKTSLIIGPIIAACGLTMAKMSGRALGHTGGTIDKLESIPGLKTTLSPDEFEKVYKTVGVCIAGQTGNMVPADKILYSLRDVTATIDDISLIATSIMSKKLAAGATNIVLDVKTGDGAFMSDVESAVKLAKKMVAIGKNNKRNVSAIITNMDFPLGHNIGNSLEVIEVIEVLKGNVKGPLYDVSIKLATELLFLGSSFDKKECEAKIIEVLNNKSALNKLAQMISAQGGNSKVIDDYSLFEESKYTYEVISKEEGYISELKAKMMGEASMLLGAGRITKKSQIDMAAGIVLNKNVQDYVKKGECLAYLHTKLENVDDIKKMILDAYTIGKEKVKPTKSIFALVTNDKVEYYN